VVAAALGWTSQPSSAKNGADAGSGNIGGDAPDSGNIGGDAESGNIGGDAGSGNIGGDAPGSGNIGGDSGNIGGDADAGSGNIGGEMTAMLRGDEAAAVLKDNCGLYRRIHKGKILLTVERPPVLARIFIKKKLVVGTVFWFEWMKLCLD
jgi:hypothetical protein